MRGRRPKTAVQHELEGNTTHRSIRFDPAVALPDDYDNGLDPPSTLTGPQRRLWNGYVRRAPWLTVFDVPRAHLWVELHARWEANPASFPAPLIAQLRLLGSEIGLDPVSRLRMAAARPKTKSKFAGLLAGGIDR